MQSYQFSEDRSLKGIIKNRSKIIKARIARQHRILYDQELSLLQMGGGISNHLSFEAVCQLVQDFEEKF